MIQGLLALLFSLPAFAANIHFLEVKGTINPGSASYILSSLTAAQSEKADALVMRLDTPGGLLTSTRDIIQGISSSSVPVILWVGPSGASATSAGALIALSAHVVAMSPGSNIGAAHPVAAGGEEVKGAMGDKITNDTAALARAQAALRGRNAQLAEAVVTKSRSLSADEAVKEKLADFLATDFEGVLSSANGKKVRVAGAAQEITLQLSSPVTKKVDMNTQQRFLHFIADPNISAMLLSIGGLAIWVEISSGFSSIAPGVVGVFFIVLGLVSLQTLPINVGGALLLALGAVLMVAEAFITSYGLLSVGALVSIFLGGLFLIDPSAGSMRVSLSLLVPLVAGIGVVILSIGYLLARDRRRLGVDPNHLVGKEAVVSTVEGPGLAGTAQVNGELWSFECKDPVRSGDKLRVHAVHGLKLILERRK